LQHSVLLVPVLNPSSGACSSIVCRWREKQSGVEIPVLTLAANTNLKSIFEKNVSTESFAFMSYYHGIRMFVDWMALFTCVLL